MKTSKREEAGKCCLCPVFCLTEYARWEVFSRRRRRRRRYRLRYDSAPLAIEAGGRQAKATEALLCRIPSAGSGEASDRARFRNYAASNTSMTNAIGVTKTTIANRLVASDAPQAPSQATLGFVPLHPPPRQRQFRRNIPHPPSPALYGQPSSK